MFDLILFQIATSYIETDVRGSEPQLGLYYIAEYAKKHGYKIGVKKYSSNQPILSDIIPLIEEQKCKIIGFYVDSENIWILRRLIIYIKKKIPNLLVLVGGPQVTGDPELCLKRIPLVDFAIVGEGERPVVEILDGLSKHQPNLHTIKGLAYNTKDGAFHFNGSQEPVKDLEIYPFPRRKEYSLDKDIVFDQILTGRGCVGKCAFCFEGNKKENKLRLRNVNSVIEEVDYIISNLGERKCFAFLDDTFILNSDRTTEICKHLIEKYNGSVAWFCEARVDILQKNIHLLPLLKQAGLVRIQLGGESGNQNVLNAYNKNMQTKELLKCVRNIYEAGIPSIYVNFIIGGAFESLETFNDTLNFAKEIIDTAPGCVEVGASLFSPYVGTPMRNHPEKYGIKLIDKDLLRGCDGNVVSTVTEDLNEQKILQLKLIFEQEISEKMDELVKTLDNNELLVHYILARDYGMTTQYYTKSNRVEAYKHYFTSVCNWGFDSIDTLSYDELSLSIPFRTIQLISDGEEYYRIVGNQYVKNSDLENAVFLLSSGKICYYEIVQILSRSDRFKDVIELEKRIIDVYRNFDKERLVVWKKSL